jgi:hypothetical protein
MSFAFSPDCGEGIALNERDFDIVRGTLSVTKARVYGVDKDTAKTHEDRVIQLCPRAIAVLSRQRALAKPAQNLRALGLGILASLLRAAHLRQLESHDRQESALCIPTTWRQRDDHWRTYAAWMKGALESDIALIQAAMNGDGRVIERVSNTQIALTVNVSAVAGGLATRRQASETQVADKKGQKKWRRGWDSNPRAGITRPSDFESAPL